MYIKAEVKKLFDENPNYAYTQKEICELIGCSNKDIIRYLIELKCENYIKLWGSRPKPTKRGFGKKTRPHVYIKI